MALPGVWSACRQMDYYHDNTQTSSVPRHYLPDCVEHDVGTTDASDGAYVYGACDVSRTDNGDLIATLSDTSADDSAAYPFLKSVVIILIVIHS